MDIPGYMGGKLLVSKLVADRVSGRVLGFQCIGPGDASKRVATVAMAHSRPVDRRRSDQCRPALCAALLAGPGPRHRRRPGAGEQTHRPDAGAVRDAVKQRVDQGADCFILDTRGPAEFEALRLGIGETLIPLGALRDRLDELPQDKDREIILYCQISLRGYEAAVIIEAHGWRNVKVMEGGVAAWPYPREK